MKNKDLIFGYININVYREISCNDSRGYGNFIKSFKIMHFINVLLIRLGSIELF